MAGTKVDEKSTEKDEKSGTIVSVKLSGDDLSRFERARWDNEDTRNGGLVKSRAKVLLDAIHAYLG